MKTVKTNRNRVVRNGSTINVKDGMNSNEFRQEFIGLINKFVGNNQPFSRLALARFMADSACHDIDTACDYPKHISFEMYWSMWKREGIANRVVSIFPSECWTVEPWVYETENVDPEEQTEFEKEWIALNKRYNLYGAMSNLDEISGIGNFGVLLLGIDDGKKLDQPVDGIDSNGDYVEGEFPKRNLIYAMPFDQGHVQIAEYEKNQNSKRYGLPTFYNITIADPSVIDSFGRLSPPSTSPPASLDGKSVKVHWTRVIHVADNAKISKVFGSPRMENVFNYLLNIRRILGGSAEMFWNGGFPGTSFEVPPEIAAEVELDKEELAEEVNAFFSGLKRYMALRGVTAKQLFPNIADPQNHIVVQIQAVCIAIGVPLRIFMGTEEARLASMQDKDTWNRKVHRRHNVHCTPNIVRPVVDRLQAMRVLRRVEEYFVKWPDVYSISETDRADIMGKKVKTIAEYIRSGAHKFFPPLEFLTMIMELSPAEAEIVIDAAIAAADDPELDFMDVTEPGGAVTEGAEDLDKSSGPRPRFQGNQLLVNPVTRCMSEGKKGFRSGESDRCYTYSEGDTIGKRRAKKKAQLQSVAIRAARKLQAMESEDNG